MRRLNGAKICQAITKVHKSGAVIPPNLSTICWLKETELKNEELNDTDEELLDEFCQVLVDYIASGHFGLYNRIIKKQERRKSVSELALRIYPSIDKTTQTVLSFNEKYDPSNGQRKLAELQVDLSILGEDLVSRIELEDRLIQSLQESRETTRN